MNINNARIVMRDAVVHGRLSTREDRITGIDAGSGTQQGDDWDGDWLLPGLVELHTDNLEKHISPRPGVAWPAVPAVVAHDAQLAASGITTVLDAIALGDVSPLGTRKDHLQGMLDAIAEARAAGMLRVDHRLHLRCELSSAELGDSFKSIAGTHPPAMVSLMDHTPGQRQFTDMARYREYYQGKYGLDDSRMEAFTAHQLHCHRQFSKSNRERVVQHCRTHHIALASHDDATAAHIDEARGEGVVLSEFPTTLESARAARQSGLAILMGAPNVVRGGSHSGNISAMSLAHEGLLDVLSSDYVPASLLHSAFLVHEHAGWSLAAAVALVSARPAVLAGFADRGEIAQGRRADFIRVRVKSGIPHIVETWAGGRRIF